MKQFPDGIYVFIYFSKSPLPDLNTFQLSVLDKMWNENYFLDEFAFSGINGYQLIGYKLSVKNHRLAINWL